MLLSYSFIWDRRAVAIPQFHLSCFSHVCIMFVFPIGWIMLKHLWEKIQPKMEAIYSLLWHNSQLWITTVLIHPEGSNNYSQLSILNWHLPIFKRWKYWYKLDQISNCIDSPKHWLVELVSFIVFDSLLWSRFSLPLNFLWCRAWKLEVNWQIKYSLF